MAETSQACQSIETTSTAVLRNQTRLRRRAKHSSSIHLERETQRTVRFHVGIPPGLWGPHKTSRIVSPTYFNISHVCTRKKKKKKFYKTFAHKLSISLLCCIFVDVIYLISFVVFESRF